VGTNENNTQSRAGSPSRAPKSEVHAQNENNLSSALSCSQTNRNLQVMCAGCCSSTCADGDCSLLLPNEPNLKVCAGCYSPTCAEGDAPACRSTRAPSLPWEARLSGRGVWGSGLRRWVLPCVNWAGLKADCLCKCYRQEESGQGIDSLL
jgi:hypothetical protein